MDENLHHRQANFPLVPGYSQQARNRQWHFGFPELSYSYRYCSCKSHLPVLGMVDPLPSTGTGSMPQHVQAATKRGPKGGKKRKKNIRLSSVKGTGGSNKKQQKESNTSDTVVVKLEQSLMDVAGIKTKPLNEKLKHEKSVL
jgi:hypothetical protein